MASGLGLVAGIALARAEGVPQDEELRIALVPFVLGLTPVSLIVTQTLARNAVPPPVPAHTSVAGGPPNP
jgi:hypothetical protein